MKAKMGKAMAPISILSLLRRSTYVTSFITLCT
jgi:hypothetical protein